MSLRYRKSGCLPCKKSHKRCDELKPRCSFCQRRDLKCDYGSLFVLFNKATPETTGGKSTKQSTRVKTEAQSFDSRSSITAEDEANAVDRTPEILSLPLKPLIHPIPISSGVSSITSPLQSGNQIINQSLLPLNNFDSFLDLDIDLKYLDYILSDELRNVTPVIPTEHVASERFVLDWDSITPEDLSKLIELNDPLLLEPTLRYDDPKVSKFIRAYFRQSKCVGNYIFNPKTEENVLIDWMELLEPSYPILSDVVYVMTSYAISVLRPQDEHWSLIKNEYLKKCINSLITNINTHHPFELVSLLTVVILFYSVDTSTTANTWRKHLTCAFALIQRFDSFFLSKELVATMYDRRLTDVTFDLYHFLKDNFIYAESIAWISSPAGGILKSMQEIDFLFSRDSYCEPILVDHLVLVKGSSKYLTSVFGKVIRIIFSLKEKYLVNLSGSNCVFVVIPTDEYYQSGLALIEELSDIEYKDLDLISIDDMHLRATLRYSNRAFVLGLKLFIMITLLREPVYSPKIQEISQMIADCLSNMPYSASQSVGIHWPMFIAALCSQAGPLRQTFVAHLTDIVNRGLTVATYTLQRLDLAWNCMAKGEIFDESMYDHITF